MKAPPAEAIVLIMYESAYDTDNYTPSEWNTAESDLGAPSLDIMGTRRLGKFPTG